MDMHELVNGVMEVDRLVGEGGGANVRVEWGLEFILREVLGLAVNQDLEAEMVVRGAGMADGWGREGEGVGHDSGAHEDGSHDHAQDYAQDFGGAVGTGMGRR
jgi:hypothetical protein